MISNSPQSAIQQPWVQTPLAESSVLSRAAGCRIFLKLENLQPSGSFKSRGIGNLIRHHVKAVHDSPNFNLGDLHCFSSSGGNAGLACVTAACSMGIKSTVCVPSSTAESMIIKLRAAGATKVIVQGEAWANADAHLREVLIPAAEHDGAKAIYVPPFNDPLIWHGAATMVDEIKSQLPDNAPPDAVICSVGGGGLFAGIMEGLDKAGPEWADKVKVFALETVGADSLNQSVKAGELITLPAITSIAKTLGASQVARQAFEQAQRPNVHCLTLTDAEAVEGVWRFADDERVLVEPACGVSVALAYRGRLKKLLNKFSKDSKVVIVVCGGSGVSLADIAKWKAMFESELPDEAAEMGDEIVRVPSNVQS